VKKTSILVVEDSPTQAKQAVFELERAGFAVRLAENGVMALQAMEEAPPDVVVTDIVMPKMDGFDLCSAIRKDERFQGIPVILLTQLDDPEDVIHGADVGANSFIVKPYDPEFLNAQIRVLLANRELGKRCSFDVEFEFMFQGRTVRLSTDRMQFFELLMSSFENLLVKHRELEGKNRELEEAVAQIKTLHGLIPICMHCKKIRNDEGYWEQLEVYLRDHTEAEFSHALCPGCRDELYPGVGKPSGKDDPSGT